jgi:hypothetical protein
MRIAALALGLVITAGACASSGTAAGEQSATGTATTRRTNVITTQEIGESRAPSVTDLIRQLRPSWPGQGSAVSIVVNNDVMGGYAMLNNQPLSTVRQINYLTKSEAQMKWGARVQEVIQIITR